MDHRHDCRCRCGAGAAGDVGDGHDPLPGTRGCRPTDVRRAGDGADTGEGGRSRSAHRLGSTGSFNAAGTSNATNTRTCSRPCFTSRACRTNGHRRQLRRVGHRGRDGGAGHRRGCGRRRGGRRRPPGHVHSGHTEDLWRACTEGGGCEEDVDSPACRRTSGQQVLPLLQACVPCAVLFSTALCVCFVASAAIRGRSCFSPLALGSGCCCCAGARRPWM